MIPRTIAELVVAVSSEGWAVNSHFPLKWIGRSDFQKIIQIRLWGLNWIRM